MIANYLNNDATEFFNRIDTDENRVWVWLFLKIIKERYPKADHWTTRGKADDSYIQIKIGKKDRSDRSGSPVFIFALSGRCPIFNFHKDIGKEIPGWDWRRSTYFPMKKDIENFLYNHNQLISNQKKDDLSGNSLYPIDYPGNNATPAQDTEETPVDNSKDTVPSPPLNQILFGPPGTGKTYATIDEALRILDPAFLKEHETDRKALKEKFDSLDKSGNIRFVTFHQSFSYEDFVEGLRAVTNDENQLEYSVEPGVFKRLCDDAITQRIQSLVSIRSNPTIWKISINGTGESSTKNYCLDHGEARIGWGKTGDLTDKSRNQYFQDLDPKSQGTINSFVNDINIGDILICIHSIEEIGAVGVITGDYYYDKNIPQEVDESYNHVRSVNWIYRDLNLSILPLNENKYFAQKTVYQIPIKRFSWADLLSYIEKSGKKPTVPGLIANAHQPFVLIIDEINRGNISRIFGELITLIEPSKRAGAPEALSVTLPYSKKPFSVPANVYLIGTMNTADRSLAGLDIALRRRFTFKEMPPKPELLDAINIENVNIGQLLRKMNARIEVLLDRDHCLGHAYFIPLKENPSLSNLKFIFRQQILPLLQEYFFEDWERIAWVLNDQNEPKALQFIQKSTQPSLTDLFGADIASNLQNTDKRWTINEKAFDKIESYAGILNGKSAAPLTVAVGNSPSDADTREENP